MFFKGRSGEVMGESRILFYHYLDDDTEDEETDLTGQMEMPRTGDIMYRKEKVWRVTGVYAVPLTAQSPTSAFIYWIFRHQNS